MDRWLDKPDERRVKSAEKLRMSRYGVSINMWKKFECEDFYEMGLLVPHIEFLSNMD